MNNLLEEMIITKQKLQNSELWNYMDKSILNKLDTCIRKLKENGGNYNESNIKKRTW